MKPKKPAKLKKPVKTRKAKPARKGTAHPKIPKARAPKKSLKQLKSAPKAPTSAGSGTRPPKGGTPNRKPQAESELPEVLFEGDRPGAFPSGPGQRYALGATAPEEHFATQGELPESYGTQQVLVTARDPHWLYVHWDLTREQLRDYNAQSIHKHLVLRLTQPDAEAEAAGEVHVHPESRHWFVHVAQAGVKYAVELGYYGKAKGWTNISTSAPTLAPPDVVSANTETRFATIPMDVALSQLVETVKSGAAKNLSLAHALEELRLAGHPLLPSVTEGGEAQPWTPEQEHALAEVISMKQVGRVTVGSMDITELVQRGLQENFSSIIAALAGPGGVSSISSPQGGAPASPGGFWFNLNAELIVYGATEPTASVTIGGRPVKLRPDGSFSYRFALPDGQYELPVTAVSADGTEARHADLKFSRATDIVGDVGQHPQDPALKTPLPENT